MSFSGKEEVLGNGITDSPGISSSLYCSISPMPRATSGFCRLPEAEKNFGGPPTTVQWHPSERSGN